MFGGNKHEYSRVALDHSDEEQDGMAGGEDDFQSDDGLTAADKRAQNRVFDLSLEYSDEEEDGINDRDALLDYRQYSAMRRVTCCGADLTALTAACCCCWRWRSMGRRQRQLLLLGLLLAISLGLLALLLLLGGLAEEAVAGGGHTLGSGGMAWGSSASGSVDSGATATISDLTPEQASSPLCTWSNYTLPQQLSPYRYQLQVSAMLDPPYEVEGWLEVEVEVGVETRCMVLHGVGMMLRWAVLQEEEGGGGGRGSSGSSGLGAAILYNADLGQYTLAFPRLLPRPTARVAMRFSYVLGEGLSGFYRSSYTLGHGEAESTYPLAVTQFQATAARQALPCMDEPRFKAKYDVTLAAPQGLTVLSNMPERGEGQAGGRRRLLQGEGSSEEGGGEGGGSAARMMMIPVPEGYEVHRFRESPPMSSYLLAFVVGNLTRVSADVPCSLVACKDKPPRKVSVWGTQDRADSLRYALDTAVSVLPGYEALLGVPYQLPKMDLVAIPDFAAGAMENWGLITYRETALLADPHTSAVADLRGVSLTVAHEMAHMWMGDDVTMSQWGELWLNEGFASYLEAVGTDLAHPDLQALQMLYVEEAVPALQFDARNSTHPLSMPDSQVQSDEKVDALFDAVSYDKGGSVLRMLRAYLNGIGSEGDRMRRRLERRRSARRSSRLLMEAGGGGGAGQGQEAAAHRGNKEEEGMEEEKESLQKHPDPFLGGVQRYLRLHHLSSATAVDLWSCMDQATGLPVSDWMARWTYVEGYPLVRVQLAGEGKRDVVLDQSPFRLHSQPTCKEEEETGSDGASAPPWWIPISYTTSQAPTHIHWSSMRGCKQDSPLATLPGSSSGSGGAPWVKVNAGQYGLYRVAYPQQLLDAFADSYASGAGGSMDGGHSSSRSGGSKDGGSGSGLSANDYAGLLDDSYALAMAGRGNVTDFLNLFSALLRRPAAEYQPWAVAEPHLRQMLQLLPCSKQWAAYVSSNMRAWAAGVEAVGSSGDGGGDGSGGVLPSSGGGLAWLMTDTASQEEEEEGVSSLDRQLRPLLLLTAATFGNQDVRSAAAAIVRDGSALQRLHPGLAHAVLDVAVMAGDAETYSDVQQLYRRAEDATDKRRKLMALTYAAGDELSVRTLRYALSDEVRSQDRSSVISHVAQRGGNSLEQAWAFLRANYRGVWASLGGDIEASRALGGLLGSVAGRFASQQAIDELYQLFDRHLDILDERSYADHAAESIAANMRWVRAHGDAACEWVQTQGQEDQGQG